MYTLNYYFCIEDLRITVINLCALLHAHPLWPCCAILILIIYILNIPVLHAFHPGTQFRSTLTLPCPSTCGCYIWPVTDVYVRQCCNICIYANILCHDNNLFESHSQWEQGIHLNELIVKEYAIMSRYHQLLFKSKRKAPSHKVVTRNQEQGKQC